MIQGATLKGKIVPLGQLSAAIKTSGILVGEISKPTGYEMYSGEYDVTPKVTTQKLLTNQKVMNDDVTINKIPCFEVSNEAGGTTVSIGKEV